MFHLARLIEQKQLGAPAQTIYEIDIEFADGRREKRVVRTIESPEDSGIWYSVTTADPRGLGGSINVRADDKLTLQ